MLPQDQPTAWMKLPSQLQHQFFKDAEREAEKVKQSLAEKLARIETLKKSIRTEKMAKDEDWKRFRIAAVDGSNSPATSERLGVRYGAYSAGYMIFEGSKIVDEGYRSGSFSQEQITDQDLAQKTMSMLRTNLERDVALHCLKQDVDYVLIDGSFFGFRAEASAINRRDIGIEGYEDGSKLTEQVAWKSWNLLKSGKGVGVIKRTRTSVIDGWLAKLKGDTSASLNMNDKYIMTYMLPVGHWFAFEWLFDKKHDHHYYARFRNIHRLVEKEKKNVSIDEIWRLTVKNFENSCVKNLFMNGDLVNQSARFFARPSASAPFQLEIFEKADVSPLLPYFLAFHNPATGLPWPIDLIDESVSMPQGFTREFVDEVQARLLRDPEMKDKLKLMEFFSYLNPQKEEA